MLVHFLFLKPKNSLENTCKVKKNSASGYSSKSISLCQVFLCSLSSARYTHSMLINFPDALKELSHFSKLVCWETSQHHCVLCSGRGRPRLGQMVPWVHPVKMQLFLKCVSEEMISRRWCSSMLELRKKLAVSSFWFASVWKWASEVIGVTPLMHLQI